MTNVYRLLFSVLYTTKQKNDLIKVKISNTRPVKLGDLANTKDKCLENYLIVLCAMHKNQMAVLFVWTNF